MAYVCTVQMPCTGAELMPRLHLMVLASLVSTARNETRHFLKCIFKFANTFLKTHSKFSKSNFMPAILSRLSVLFINCILRGLDNTKIFLN